MNFVGLLNRLTHRCKLITKKFELSTIFRNCGRTFCGLAKLITKVMNTFNRCVTEGTLKRKPHGARIIDTDYFSNSFFRERSIQYHNSLLIISKPLGEIGIRNCFVTPSYFSRRRSNGTVGMTKETLAGKNRLDLASPIKVIGRGELNGYHMHEGVH
ncbi:hypothetical protein HanRHA438_Chr13g0599661 [Helianthus annuus]|nr:hypothetical protein HanRHA438_Chr13g0599661 [Helianthus annuus]